MNPALRKLCPTVFFFLSALLLGGCLMLGEGQSEATRYYTLSPIQADPLAQFSEKRPSFLPGIGPVRIAAYLDRPQLMKRRSAHEFEVIDAALWAEPLQENLARALAANLAGHTGNPQVLLFPWRAMQRPSHQITIEVRRFDVGPDARAYLQADWAIQTQNGGPSEMSRQSEFSAQLRETDAAGSVAALSETLGALSREIALALADLAAQDPD
ncbi:hypothetical protein SAMN05660860_01147 [Geoalkalibacter ferrihydriticus]|uniref:ABC-type transport auxiliary lipoprotein component domain-containing protein n=2 Tax=Geoalkalibacter ferrihydriticus TaxID=392333 RepID=A0A0C2DW69_9BACT|nr:PqiC family protein [Geoalkalibacter ferrihydriticus]KIH77679.1 hypothetical protein GFER_03165 [Geoalkalibacter ferrihydriticus DSM 17813]SDL73443.1 hypothetical protein SAMN05660860_01147 [Geoalkalibacter ferrihydriticus]